MVRIDTGSLHWYEIGINPHPPDKRKHWACNRREFLTAAAQATATVALSGCTSSPQRHKTGDGLVVIDAHTHFYDPSRPQGVPWPPRDDPLLYRRVLPRDYRLLPVPGPVAGTVVVEASPWIEDNQWVLDLAAKEPFILGLVGNLPAGTKQFAGHLKRLAANPLFLGIRIRGRRLEGSLNDPALVSDLKLLADYNLSLDLVGGSEILDFAVRLSGSVPGLRLIIDHLAGLVVDGKTPPPAWREGMTALAAKGNVFCKLSGLVEGTGRSDGSAPQDVEFYQPALDAMRTLFGPQRLIYASNWPVSERFAPLATVQGIIQDYFRAFGPSAEEQVFSLSSQTAYCWKRRS